MDLQVIEPDLARLRFCACGNLRGAARAITQFYDEALQPVGLRATQYSLLTAIVLLGRPTLTTMAEVLVMDRTTLTRNLQLLEKQGFIEVVPGDDRRTREVSLTDKGRDAVLRGFPLWQQAQAQVVRELGEERFGSLLRDLSAVVSIVQPEQSD